MKLPFEMTFDRGRLKESLHDVSVKELLYLFDYFHIKNRKIFKKLIKEI